MKILLNLIRKLKTNKKITFISIYLIFFLIGDILFSNFVYKKDLRHNCYRYLENFFHLQKNCYAKEKWVRNVKSYDVYTDGNGFRFSGKKNKDIGNKIAIFFGGSFTYGMGLDYKKTFVGLIENGQKEFEILNLAVPGYSPTVFNYQLKKLIKNEILPKKIFFVLDISDVSEEASQWDKKDKYARPIQIKKTKEEDKNTEVNVFFKNFTKNNFKGSRLIARSTNNFFRFVRLYFSSFEEKLKKPGHTAWGNFLYMNLEDTDQKLWKPFGFNKGIEKIKKNLKEISILANSLNADLYIVIYPWPDTLEYGQNKFNWEKFSENLCYDVSCTKLINFFPDFKKVKEHSDDWLTKLYIDGDLHLTEYGQKIIAKKLLSEAFIN